LGSRLGKSLLGSFSDAAAFSFSYYKPLSSLSGNGGMLVCRNSEIADKVDALLNFWKLDPLIAAAGKKFHKISLPDLATVKVKFDFLEGIISSRDKICACYEDGLRGISGIIALQRNKGVSTVRENFLILSSRRDLLRAYLHKCGVDTDMPYEPVHRAACCFVKGAKDASFRLLCVISGMACIYRFSLLCAKMRLILW